MGEKTASLRSHRRNHYVHSKGSKNSKESKDGPNNPLENLPFEGLRALSNVEGE